jgi:hypothetical protein
VEQDSASFSFDSSLASLVIAFFPQKSPSIVLLSMDATAEHMPKLWFFFFKKRKLCSNGAAYEHS